MKVLSSADFFQTNLSQKVLSGTLSECQMVLIQIRADFLSVLIWVQTVCKGYQQTTKVATSKTAIQQVSIKTRQGNMLSHKSIFNFLNSHCAILFPIFFLETEY